jgi:hypothetical protein
MSWAVGAHAVRTVRVTRLTRLAIFIGDLPSFDVADRLADSHPASSKRTAEDIRSYSAVFNRRVRVAVPGGSSTAAAHQ